MKFKEFILSESKQDIINLGFPPLIASMMYQKFGNLAFMLAKWYRDFKCHKQDATNWWNRYHTSFLRNDANINDLLSLLDATKDPDLYKKTLDDLGWYVDSNEIYDDYYMQEQKQRLLAQIQEKFFNDIFFNYYSLTQDIASGQLKDLARYRDLNFWDAQERYDKKRVFQDMTPIKIYPNGWKWINVGKRCYLLGHLMKNCGSAGVMSLDEDRTIIALFDKGNKPHVMVTYSPNEKRISGDEGAASTEVKPAYHNYVIDLAQTLGANFDANKSKSDLLKIKWLLRGKVDDVQKVRGSNVYSPLYMFTTPDSRRWYTNGYTVISADDVEKLRGHQFGTKTGSLVANALNRINMQNVDQKEVGVQYIPLSNFATQI